MLDKECLKLMKKFNKLSDNGSYKVFEWQDLSAIVSLKVESLKQDVKHLSQNGLIDVKYLDDKQVCLSVLPRGRELNEEHEMLLYSHKTLMKVMLWSGLFTGFMAFIGAFLAILVGR